MPLIEDVANVCRRLGDHGWRDLMLRVTDSALDITAAELGQELAMPLARIDRTVPGFEDFAAEGERGIEPGMPARSLLFHALASPNVLQDGQGHDLSAFPTPAELETVENYVYGAAPPSLEDLHARGGDLAIVVFATEYRPARQTVHRRHADLCFSRTGISRLGNDEALYDARRREFMPLAEDDPYAFRVTPARYAAYVATQLTGDEASFGPMRFRPRDGDRTFWVPLQKLFDGPECIAGHDLQVLLEAHHVNEKLRRFHQVLAKEGFDTGWREPDINNYPFVIEDELIAAFSRDPDHGTGLVMPRPQPLAQEATYQDKPLSFEYSHAFSKDSNHIYFTSLQVPPIDPTAPNREAVQAASVPEYLDGIDRLGARRAPMYMSVRHEILPDGGERNLNERPDVLRLVRRGGYRARHYTDADGDGWVEAACPQLAASVPRRLPAFSLVACPSFFPYCEQRQLMEWWRSEVPEEIRLGLWAITPRALSDRRLAANVRLPVGFSIHDNTVTAIISQPHDGPVSKQPLDAPQVERHSTLPDGTAGLFDPGWETTQDRTEENLFYLQSYGLGSPFVEDAKLCASLGAYWPGVSPDATRTFQPDKKAQQDPQPWPTVCPLTDEEIGIVEAPGGGYYPWDGVRGPQLVTRDGRQIVQYPDINHADYLDTVDKLTASLTAKVDYREYEARVLAMADVYWALGIRNEEYLKRYQKREALDRIQRAKADWAVLSFRKLEDGTDQELRQAEEQTQTELVGPHRYRFHVYRWGWHSRDPEDFRKVLVEMEEQVILYADLVHVLLQRDGEAWEVQRSPQRS
jgi:hypothetical protein